MSFFASSTVKKQFGNSLSFSFVNYVVLKKIQAKCLMCKMNVFCVCVCVIALHNALCQCSICV